MSETETENVLSEGSHKKFNIKNILLIVLGVIAAAVLIFLLKEFADNFYIIKHRYFNRENTFCGKKYRTIKDTRKYISLKYNLDKSEKKRQYSEELMSFLFFLQKIKCKFFGFRYCLGQISAENNDKNSIL